VGTKYNEERERAPLLQCSVLLILCFADAEHPGPAFCADTLIARFAVLHPDGLDVLHFSVGLAFHAVSFH
jgi:hypothetical protein